MLGKAKKGSLIPLGEKPGVRLKETRGDVPNFCVGVRDPGRDPEFLYGCKRPKEISRNFCMGVRNPGRCPEFLCGCKRPEEIS